MKLFAQHPDAIDEMKLLNQILFLIPQLEIYWRKSIHKMNFLTKYHINRYFYTQINRMKLLKRERNLLSETIEHSNIYLGVL